MMFDDKVRAMAARLRIRGVNNKNFIEVFYRQMTDTRFDKFFTSLRGEIIDALPEGFSLSTKSPSQAYGELVKSKRQDLVQLLERERDQRGQVLNHNYRAPIQIIGRDPKEMYFGVEVEVKCPRDEERHYYAHQVHAKFKDSEVPFVILTKHDGSIGGAEERGNHGFEIVTMPCDASTQEWIWSTIFDGRSPLTTDPTCGVHVHVSRAPLGRMQIAKAVVFTNSPENRAFIQRVSGRKNNDYCKVECKGLADVRHYEKANDRYAAVNITNEHTVEFRMFAGTTDPRSIIRAVLFCRSLLEFCSMTKYKSLSYTDYLRWLYNDQDIKSFDYTALVEHFLSTECL